MSTQKKTTRGGHGWKRSVVSLFSDVCAAFVKVAVMLAMLCRAGGVR
ncbi:hypothetical protein [Solidesulfovibrio alcoholivorans]|nr:hypothetical protein [Solidesulfovibrio alcoholivorans]